MKSAARTLVIGCAVVAAGAVPALAAARHGTHADVGASAVRRVDAPLHPVSYDGVGAIVSAPPRDAKPVFTQSDVVKMLSGDNFQQTVSGGSSPSTISLVMYENAFGLTHPGKPDTPSVPNQLAWLVTSNGALMVQAAAGPVQTRNVTTGPPRRSVCTSYVAVSAITGENLDGFSMCD